MTEETTTSSSPGLANHQEVVGLPSESLSLKLYLSHDRSVERRREALHQQVSKPIRANMLLKERTAAPGGDRARNSQYVGSRGGAIYAFFWPIHCLLRQPTSPLADCCPSRRLVQMPSRSHLSCLASAVYVHNCGPSVARKAQSAGGLACHGVMIAEAGVYVAYRPPPASATTYGVLAYPS